MKIKMKMIIALMGLLFTLSSFACWKVDGTLGVDGETWKLSQKFEHGKEYAFPMGTFILRMTINPGKNDLNQLVYVIEEKKGLKLTEVTQGKEQIKVGQKREIFAKGHPGQPHSIITLKISKI